MCVGAGAAALPRAVPVLVLALALALALVPLPASGQEFPMPENPLRGRFVFEQKGCITCHAIKGEGGKVGPDLGQRKFYGSFLELASIMWNHLPEMVRRMRELDLPFPRFTKEEMVDLVAYLYYLRYLGEPGDLYRGKILIQQKGCLACHSVGGKGGSVGPAFDRLAKYVSPLYLATALWNHGPEMEKRLQEMGMSRPRFEGGEIVDLSAYIREASRGTVQERVFMAPGNPKAGEEVFEKKGCLKCHSVNGKGGRVGPDLGKVEWKYSVTEIAGLMWNHGAEMGKLMRERKIEWPRFSGREMADLIAYLYFLGFRDPPGDARVGGKLFEQKGCSSCHGEGSSSAGAPSLSQMRPLSSTMEMARVMWNHAPVMEEKIAERIIKWPELTGSDMRHLYEFLRELQSDKSEK